MPVLRFRDDGTIGQALSQLAGGVNSMFDPRMQLHGDVMRQQIAASRANQANTELQTRQLQGQLDAQRTLGASMGSLYDVQNPRPDFTMAPDRFGPAAPAPIQQQQNGVYDANRAFTVANAQNAISRGGSGMDALRVGPAALGMGQVMLNGAPTDEQTARTTQTMLMGQLPDANTPLTDAGQQLLQRRATENEIAKSNRAPLKFSSPNEVYMTRSPAGEPTYHRLPESMGQAGFTGNNDFAQANAIMERVVVKMRQNAATPEDLDMYDVAWNKVYGGKTQIIEVNGQKQVVQTQDPAPANRPAPTGLRQAMGFGAGGVPVGDQIVSGAPQAAAAPGAAGVQTGATLGRKEGLPSEQITLQGLLAQMESGDDLLNKMTAAGNMPGAVGRELAKPGALGDNALGNIAQGFLTSDTAREFQGAAQAFLDGVLRKVSGAVIGANEYRQVEGYTIPKSGDSPEFMAWKAMNRKLIKEAWQSGALGTDPVVIAGNVRTLVEQRNPLQGGPSRGAPAPQTPAAAPGGADPYADVREIIGYGRR